MKIFQLVIRELFERSVQLWTSLIAVSLGIAIMVAIGSITKYSELAVAGKLDALGANILILPKDATVQDYSSADLQRSTIPESYVTLLTDSGSFGIDNISAKLSVPVEIKGKKATLTGILPKSELSLKSIKQGISGFFSSSQWSGSDTRIADINDTEGNTVPRRIIDDLAPDKVAVGSDLGETLKLKKGDFLDMLGRRFAVAAVLPVTGTIDDGRIFAHLHTVQQLTGQDSMLQSIEITGCYSTTPAELVSHLNTLLPDARVVTIQHIVAAQQKTNAMMRRISLALLIMIVLVGGAGIANFMFANVYERRREIGIFAALGARPGWIVQLFLIKGVIVGIAGGLLGYIAGTVLAVAFGAHIAGVPVHPVASFAGWSLLVATVISLIASVVPAMTAAAVDPSSIMKEE